MIDCTLHRATNTAEMTIVSTTRSGPPAEMRSISERTGTGRVTATTSRMIATISPLTPSTLGHVRAVIAAPTPSVRSGIWVAMTR